MEVIDSSDSGTSLSEMEVSYTRKRKGQKCRRDRNKQKNKPIIISEDELNEISDDESGLYTWCAVIVEMGTFASRHLVLNTIIQNVQPHIFIPVLCQTGEMVNKFYICNSDAALRKLADISYLCVFKELSFQLRVNDNDIPYNPIDIRKTIDDLLKVRMTMGSGELDLSDFHNHPDIVNKLYIPLCFPANQVLVTSRVNALSLTDYIHTLNLENNGLTDIKGFSMGTVFKNVTTLNLSNNNLPNMRILFQCRDLDLKCLHLDRNELCSKYSTGSEYIIPVKMFFPGIKQLDCKHFSENKFPLTIRNFTVDRNVTGLVDHFMETYYRLFDSEEIGLLLKMYSETALFNIIFKKNLRYFRKRKNFDCCQGSRTIINYFNSLPAMQHDPFSFSVDVPFTTNDAVCIVISGALKLPTTSLSEEEPVFDFTRTFILVRSGEEQYKITNDMFYIFSRQTADSDAFSVTTVSKARLTLTPEVFSGPTKIGLIELLVKITHMSENEAAQCLEKVSWNFQNALRDVVEVLSSKLKQ